jgi:hypothetical protein
MNGTVQRTHRTKVEQLEARIAVLETVVDDLARYLSKWGPAISGTLEQHEATVTAQTAHCRGIAEQYYDRFRAIEATTDKLTRGFWHRLRWIATGR